MEDIVTSISIQDKAFLNYLAVQNDSNLLRTIKQMQADEILTDKVPCSGAIREGVPRVPSYTI